MSAKCTGSLVTPTLACSSVSLAPNATGDPNAALVVVVVVVDRIFFKDAGDAKNISPNASATSSLCPTTALGSSARLVVLSAVARILLNDAGDAANISANASYTSSCRFTAPFPYFPGVFVPSCVATSAIENATGEYE
jgi:hypothetical protein